MIQVGTLLRLHTKMQVKIAYTENAVASLVTVTSAYISDGCQGSSKPCAAVVL